MKIRQVLAAQVRDRMAKKPDLDTQTKLSKSAGVTQSTVWRVLECQVGASVDVVEALGKAFGVPPVALLLDADQSSLIESWGRLNDDEKSRVTSFMQVTLAGRASNIPQQSKYWIEEQSIPPSLAAASHRATARNPARETPQNANVKATGTSGKHSTT